MPEHALSVAVFESAVWNQPAVAHRHRSNVPCGVPLVANLEAGQRAGSRRFDDGEPDRIALERSRVREPDSLAGIAVAASSR